MSPPSVPAGIQNFHFHCLKYTCACIGEDRVSLERHTKVLLDEIKKRRPNLQVVEDLMSKTFSMRRNDILENSYYFTSLFAKYPFLKDPEVVR